MSERALAFFLHSLLHGTPHAAEPLLDRATLEGLLTRPAPLLQPLLTSHIEQLLAPLPQSDRVYPSALSAATLWVGAALNNLVWAQTMPDAQLLGMTLRLSEALPPATTPADALAYQSLLRYAHAMSVDADWLPVVQTLLKRSPLTAAWWPRLHQPDTFNWALLVALVQQKPLGALLRDRFLVLQPTEAQLSDDQIDLDMARINAEIGRLLVGLQHHGGELVAPFLLAFYEADCALLQRLDGDQPVWPVIQQLAAARRSDDALVRRNASRVLARYRALVALMADATRVQPYTRLDGRFLQQIAVLVPATRWQWQERSAA
ncbi:MAG: hypothetical protein HC837_04800 [Chloroflexaceae bacterium]|nr:hypothetical protein [Chloroflexaceae bacterium]